MGSDPPTVTEEKRTWWNRAWRWARRRVREWWLSTDPPGRAIDFRDAIEHGHGRLKSVRRVIADLEMSADLNSRQYRDLRRQLVREEARSQRLLLLGMFACLVAVFTFAFLVARSVSRWRRPQG